MDEDRCGSSVVWNIFSDVSLVNMIISVYNWDYLQVGLYDVEDYFSTSVDWSLEKIEDL